MFQSQMVVSRCRFVSSNLKQLSARFERTTSTAATQQATDVLGKRGNFLSLMKLQHVSKPRRAEAARELQEKGYANISGLIDSGTVHLLRERAHHLSSETPQAQSSLMRYSRPDLGGIIDRIENFTIDCPIFSSVFLDPDAAIPSLVQELWDQGDIVLFKDKVNFKPPGMDGFPAHQDVGAGWKKYGPEHVTVAVALDPADADNGALEFAPGLWSFRREMLHLEGNCIETDLGASWELSIMQPGDAVVFTSFAPHRSAANKSSCGRAMVLITYGRRCDGQHMEAFFRAKRRRQPTMDDPRDGLILDRFGKWVRPIE